MQLCREEAGGHACLDSDQVSVALPWEKMGTYIGAAP